MPIRSYDGPLLPGDTPAARAAVDGRPVPRTVPPPPPPPTPAAAPRVAPSAPAAPQDPPVPEAAVGVPVRVVIDGGEIRVLGEGVTVEEAIRAAHAQWEAAHVQPITWADGQPITGFAQQVLIQALETYKDLVGPNADAVELNLMIGRLQAALGEETA